MRCSEFSEKASNRIVIQSPSGGADSMGGRSVTWSDQSTVWAMIKPMSGKEVFAQDANQTRVSHVFVIRYQAALKDVTAISDYRISFDGRYYGVKYIRNLDEDMKNYGTDYQEIYTIENGVDING